MKFKKYFQNVLIEQDVDPNAGVAQQPVLTDNPQLQQSLAATDDAGATGNMAIKKMPEWKQKVAQIQQMTTSLLDEIQPTAGQPGAADIWKSMKNSLVKISKESGAMLGQLEGLTRTIPVSQKAAAQQQ